MAEKYSKLSFSPSCIIVNTDVGRTFFESCMPEIEFYPESFSVIDMIQEKENMAVPDSYCKDITHLKKGKPPESLIKGYMLMSRLKGRIKQILKNSHSIENYDLGKYI